MRRAETALAAAVLLGSMLLGSSAAWAFDAATTHAGLTERALMASSLRARLGDLFLWGPRRPLGLFETLTLEGAGARRDRLRSALAQLDPATGVRPDGGRLTAAAWLVAGTVVEEVPAGRAANHFYDPTSAGGLRVNEIAAALDPRLWDAAGFQANGQPATDWLTAADNDLSLERFLDARERSIAAPLPALRDDAAAEALLIAGALLHVIEDAAEPAHVHNDFSIDLLDGGAPFSRFVAARYGRLALPAPAGPALPLRRLADAIDDGHGGGLASRTALRFYSLGVIAGETTGRPGGATRPSGLRPLLAGPAAEGYVVDDAGLRIALWRRQPGVVRFGLDTRCYEDAASVLLAQAAQAALSALEHLFRGQLVVAADGRGVRAGDRALGRGQVRLFVEDDAGQRRELERRPVLEAAAGAPLLELPPETAGKRAIVLFRGVDANGEPLVSAAAHDPD